MEKCGEKARKIVYFCENKWFVRRLVHCKSLVSVEKVNIDCSQL